MHLSNIKLWNFRKFGSNSELDLLKPDLNLNFTKGLNVIIGENDSGKSAIIDSIKLVLRTHSFEYVRVEESDFYNSANRFRIELTFDGLTSDEAKNFTEWLGWNGTGNDAKPFLRLNYDVTRKDNRVLPTDVKAGVDDDGYLLTAEAKDYLKVTYLKPLRDAENELTAKRNSRLSQILLGDNTFKGTTDHDLVKLFEALSDGLRKYFKGELEIRTKNEANEEIVIMPLEGKQIKDKIDSYIKSFYGSNYETEFKASSIDIKAILEKLSLYLKDEPNPGLGTLNRLFMAAELVHLNKSNWTGLRLGLVEELEAHLHPQAQMQVIEAFQKQDAIQLILTTHSPNLASKIKLENLIICNNNNAFPMGRTYTKLMPDSYKFLEKFLDTTKANLFFAKGVILVEGWAEEILIPSLAKAIGINLTERGVSIVNIGHTGFDHYAKIFLRNEEPHMKIPVAVITDSDAREYEKSGDDYVKRDEIAIQQEKQQKIAQINARSDQNVQFFPSTNWTLEYSLFKSVSLSSTLQNAATAIHTATDWANFEKALATKLLNKGLSKTEIAYRIANAIDEDLNGQVDERTIQVRVDDTTDSIYYLLRAIKYASGI